MYLKYTKEIIKWSQNPNSFLSSTSTSNNSILSYLHPNSCLCACSWDAHITTRVKIFVLKVEFSREKKPHEGLLFGSGTSNKRKRIQFVRSLANTVKWLFVPPRVRRHLEFWVLAHGLSLLQTNSRPTSLLSETADVNESVLFPRLVGSSDMARSYSANWAFPWVWTNPKLHT